MIEYIYKGFKISYIVKSTNFENNSFKADGFLTYSLNQPKVQVLTPKKFQTEYISYAGAEHEIKKLLENYVDFELKNYRKMKNEASFSKTSPTKMIECRSVKRCH